MSGIYVHIPFCHSKCAYCDFYSTPRHESAAAVVDAIAAEYEMRKGEIGDEPQTIYIGGGTPSVLNDAELERLISSLPHVSGEFTVEVNPEDVSYERVALWRSLGVNRVSMGVQSLCDDELRAVGRRHTAREAVDAAEDIRRGGIENVSIDLIYGLVYQTPRSWQRSLEGILALRPAHLSAYILSYEKGTRLTAMLHAGKLRPTPDEVIEQMYDMLCEMTAGAGYEHYEISNFALPGKRSRHNSSYWQGVPYLGLGPSAHSFDGRVRRINPSSTGDYLAIINAGTTACVVDEENDDNRFNDLVMTRLRTCEGLPLSCVESRRMGQLLSDAAPYIAAGRLVLTDTHLFIPERHWLTSDAVISSLMQV